MIGMVRLLLLVVEESGLRIVLEVVVGVPSLCYSLYSIRCVYSIKVDVTFDILYNLQSPIHQDVILWFHKSDSATRLGVAVFCHLFRHSLALKRTMKRVSHKISMLADGRGC